MSVFKTKILNVNYLIPGEISFFFITETVFTSPLFGVLSNHRIECSKIPIHCCVFNYPFCLDRYFIHRHNSSFLTGTEPEKIVINENNCQNMLSVQHKIIETVITNLVFLLKHARNY